MWRAPTRSDAVFFIRRHSSGGQIGVFCELQATSMNELSPTAANHSTRLGDGPESGGDRYSVQYSVPVGPGAFETRQTTVTYRGERLVVFHDDDWEIGVGPEEDAGDGE